MFIYREMKLQKLIYLLLILFITVSCSNKKNSDQHIEIINDPANNAVVPTVVKFKDKLFSLPSPFSMSLLIRDNKIPYKRELLNSTKNISNYPTIIDKALNLGVFGANLGYLTIYEQYPEATLYFAAVKKLSEEIGIETAFNVDVIERIEQNSENKDTLLRIFSDIYREADAYLLNSDRDNLSVLIIAGGWVESLYLLTQTAQTDTIYALKKRIGEQKYPLENLIDLLRPFYNKYSPELDAFILHLVELASVYDGIEMKYKYLPPQVDTLQKLTKINSTSILQMSDFQLKSITDSVAVIRQSIVRPVL